MKTNDLHKNQNNEYTGMEYNFFTGVKLTDRLSFLFGFSNYVTLDSDKSLTSKNGESLGKLEAQGTSYNLNINYIITETISLGFEFRETFYHKVEVGKLEKRRDLLTFQNHIFGIFRF